VQAISATGYFLRLHYHTANSVKLGYQNNYTP